MVIGAAILIILLAGLLYKLMKYKQKRTLEQALTTDLEKEYEKFKQFKELEIKAIARQAEIESEEKAFKNIFKSVESTP